MTDDPLSSPHVVATAAAAAILADHRRRTLLMLFAKRACTLSEAAAVAGIDVKLLHHHVGRFRAAGLVEVVGTLGRAGRPMKLYRTVARAFVIGDEQLPHPFTDSLHNALRGSATRQSFRPGSGVIIRLDDNGDLDVERFGAPSDAVPVIDIWVRARLNASDVALLKARLVELLGDFERGGGDDRRPYLIHAAAAPGD